MQQENGLVGHEKKRGPEKSAVGSPITYCHDVTSEPSRNPERPTRNHVSPFGTGTQRVNGCRRRTFTWRDSICCLAPGLANLAVLLQRKKKRGGERYIQCSQKHGEGGMVTGPVGGHVGRVNAAAKCQIWRHCFNERRSPAVMM